MISVRDLIADCFPPESASRSGDLLLDREVTWATRPRPSPPAFGHLSGGELVLLRLSELTDVDDRATLDSTIRQLAEFGVSAVAVAGPTAKSTADLASRRNVALITLPERADLGEIERRATHLIAERRRDRQRRGHEAGRKLMELAIAGESLAAIISTLSQLSNLAVALEGRDGRLLTWFARADQPSRDEIVPLLLANRDAARSWLAIAGDASPAEPPTMHLALGTSLDRTIAPVIGREGLLGCLSLIGPGGSWSGDDALLASRGAAACAIVLAREFASIAARREIELNVLDEVLDGALRNETTLLQQARRLGHDLERPHRLLVVDLVNAADSGAVRPLVSAALERFDDELLWRIRDRFLEIVLPDLIEPDQVVATLQANLGDERVRAGLGSRHAGLAGLQRSRDEARQALMIQSRLGISAAVAHFGDLGVFRLLFAAESLPEFNDLHDETLGALVAYDQEHNADLVQTLRAWFDGKGSPKVASERLGVHRNTVLYRLERIAAMTGYDLADAETRLRLQLALSINTIKGSPASGDGLRGNRSAGAARAESVPA